jgi:hypothetical protein
MRSLPEGSGARFGGRSGGGGLVGLEEATKGVSRTEGVGEGHATEKAVGRILRRQFELRESATGLRTLSVC